jgi:hypothetical protein
MLINLFLVFTIHFNSVQLNIGFYFGIGVSLELISCKDANL